MGLKQWWSAGSGKHREDILRNGVDEATKASMKVHQGTCTDS